MKIIRLAALVAAFIAFLPGYRRLHLAHFERKKEGAAPQFERAS